MAPYSIAIVGAGPAGLALSRILSVRLGQMPENSLKVSIFERDANQHSQTDQVGTLDLHEDTGMAAMKAAGLFDEFLQYARYDGEELMIGDKNGTEMVHLRPGGKTTPGVEESRPEIDREKLVDVLLRSVGKENIQWGMKLERVTEDGILHFRDGRTEGPFDLVVGADGTWSKVRPILTSVRPRYSGICGFESIIANPNEDHPECSQLYGRGAHFAYSDCKGIMAHRLGNENIKVNFWLREDESYHSEVMKEAGADEEVLRRRLHLLFNDWAPWYRNSIPACTAFRSRALYELPVGDTYEHKKGFVLIGDSAHLMTPFSGKGANAAMRDALDLADAITGCLEKGSDMDSSIAQFETEMFERTHKVQQLTMMHKTHMFAPDAPIGFMVAMMDVIAAAKGKDLNRGFLRWIPVKRTAYALASLMIRMGSLRRRIADWYRYAVWWRASAST